mmetsp:Transcript_746/g.1385  ORF Transcript_746/g.1385 Transcript_746/m.1385 type:complete len:386 (+) Transcript_746:48-1205(+)
MSTGSWALIALATAQACSMDTALCIHSAESSAFLQARLERAQSTNKEASWIDRYRHDSVNGTAVAPAKSNADAATFDWDLCPRGFVMESGTGQIGDLCRSNSSNSTACPQFCRATTRTSPCVMTHSDDVCRSNTAFDFWKSSGLPQYENKGVIHTYFDPLGGGVTEKATLEVWEKIWKQAGFKTRVLTRADAEVSPYYQEFIDALSKANFRNGRDYETSCFLRYLAMAAVGGGWMADIDVVPTFMTPNMPLFNQGNFTVYQGFTPALVSGTRPEWERMVKELLKQLKSSVADGSSNTGGNVSMSDMFALQHLLKDDPPPYVSMKAVAYIFDWGPEMHDCQIMRIASFAVHLSHFDVTRRMNFTERDRSELMARSRAKFLECQSSR